LANGNRTLFGCRHPRHGAEELRRTAGQAIAIKMRFRIIGGQDQTALLAGGHRGHVSACGARHNRLGGGAATGADQQHQRELEQGQQPNNHGLDPLHQAHFIDNRHNQAADRAGRVAQQLAHAIALTQDQHGITGPRLGVVDGQERVAGGQTIGSQRLDRKNRQTVQTRMFDRADDISQDPGQNHCGLRSLASQCRFDVDLIDNRDDRCVDRYKRVGQGQGRFTRLGQVDQITGTGLRCIRRAQGQAARCAVFCHRLDQQQADALQAFCLARRHNLSNDFA
jgi:hypothetical protein